MKMTAKRVDWYLAPTDPDEFEKVPVGSEVMVELVKSRNPANHRRAFAFFNMVFDLQEHFEQLLPMRKWLVMKAGYYDEFIAPNGVVVYLPKSISFDSMEELEFREMFGKIIDVVIREPKFKIDDDQKMMQVLEFV